MLNSAANQDKEGMYDSEFMAKGKHFWNVRVRPSENLLFHKSNKENLQNKLKIIKRSYLKKLTKG